MQRGGDDDELRAATNVWAIDRTWGQRTHQRERWHRFTAVNLRIGHVVENLNGHGY
jgi:hypothetical protein